MDIDLALTFLEIARSRSFLRAAEHLHVTPTTVSARMRTLETLLGRALFIRNKAGAAMTPAGEQFLPHAGLLVQVWERARHQVAVPVGRRAVLSVGCEMSLWDPLLLDWLLRMRSAAPQLAIRTEVGAARELVDKVATGVLDIAIAYAPQQRPGLRVELLIEEKLIMVSTSRAARLPGPNEYIYVDWGPEFSLQHGMAFPELSNPGVTAGLGPLGREYLLAAGGAGYFRLDVVRTHLAAGRLHRVKDAPEFLYPAYAVYAAEGDASIIEPGLAGFRGVARPQASKKR
ncbi:LysR family transcriptional regulator [Variovorax sp. J31P207]|uniref:LysR family transcriptional regulator n=1 Tax=Variovorax sp. J31P207 TaxID=3053510 RepID=UPI0025756ADA|nr:LysR family transcriptional regulator [Variovorax sp. J31P207]MDM0072451.1 LysR family transcriptional regulator [Variovorax sp. J31P207]